MLCSFFHRLHASSHCAVCLFIIHSCSLSFIVEHKWMAADQINTVRYAEVTAHIMFSFIFIHSFIRQWNMHCLSVSFYLTWLYSSLSHPMSCMILTKVPLLFYTFCLLPIYISNTFLGELNWQRHLSLICFSEWQQENKHEVIQWPHVTIAPLQIVMAAEGSHAFFFPHYCHCQKILSGYQNIQSKHRSTIVQHVSISRACW